MANTENFNDQNLPTSLRALFNARLFNMLITEGILCINANPNGSTWAETSKGIKIALDKSGLVLREGKELIEAVVGATTAKAGIRAMDVEIGGQGFCITLIGPPNAVDWMWSVVRRDLVSKVGTRPFAACIELSSGDILEPILLDIGKAEPDLEGSFRRGYHHAVAAVAEALRRGGTSADELDSWVMGSGWRWRKQATLLRQLIPPAIGK